MILFELADTRNGYPDLNDIIPSYSSSGGSPAHPAQACRLSSVPLEIAIQGAQGFHGRSQWAYFHRVRQLHNQCLKCFCRAVHPTPEWPLLTRLPVVTG